MSSFSLRDNAELQSFQQNYGDDPLADRDSDLYRGEFVMGFVEKWDSRVGIWRHGELIDWDARPKSEAQFFVDVLRARGKERVLDAATGSGFHSVRLTEAGFDVVSVDGSAAILARAFENGQKRGLILKTVQADWRELNRGIHGKYDAIICLGNSFTHLHDEHDRRIALAEFYAALRHDGILILDHRNYDEMLDHGFTSNHKYYYYCGDELTVEPEYIDDGLARLKYTFTDGCEYMLSMFPLRKNYVRRLLREAGFERVRTYGDFQETHQENEPDFFIHVAEKSLLPNGNHAPSADEAAAKAEAYYGTEVATAEPTGARVADHSRYALTHYQGDIWTITELFPWSAQLRQRCSRSSGRRHRHSEMSVPITGDAMLAACLDPTRPCAADESVLSDVR